METLMGPIQLVVIGFPKDAQFKGEIRRALEEVRGRGVIRVIDALFVRKDEDGRINDYLRESDFTQEERMAMGALVGALLGLRAGDEQTAAKGAELAANAIADGAFGLGLGDLQKIDEQIQPGQAALVLLIEHTWATELKAAVRGVGGVPLVQGFLTPEAVMMLGAEVAAVVQAENTIARAHAVEGAAILEALAVVETAEEVKQAAAAEAARALIIAGLIEEAAAQDVVDTLVAAELIKQEAVADAARAVADAQKQIEQVEQAQLSGSATT